VYKIRDSARIPDQKKNCQKEEGEVSGWFSFKDLIAPPRRCFPFIPAFPSAKAIQVISEVL
jgi:hypothetical protein